MDIMTPTTHNADDTGNRIRALHSLSEPQASYIIAGLASLVTDWSIERHASCDGYLSLVLTHTAFDTSIIVDRDKAGIHVSLLLDDKLHLTSHPCATTVDTVQVIKEIAGANTAAQHAHTA